MARPGRGRGGALFMNELNAALRKRPQEDNSEDETDKMDDIEDKTSDVIEDIKTEYETKKPFTYMPIFPGAKQETNSTPLVINQNNDSEKLKELDFEPEVGMVVLNHEVAKHKLSVKPKRKPGSQRPRSRYIDPDTIPEPVVSLNMSQNFAERHITSTEKISQSHLTKKEEVVIVSKKVHKLFGSPTAGPDTKTIDEFIASGELTRHGPVQKNIAVTLIIVYYCYICQFILNLLLFL